MIFNAKKGGKNCRNTFLNFSLLPFFVCLVNETATYFGMSIMFVLL